MELIREIDADLLEAISSKDGFYPIVLVRSVWPDGTVHAHSGNGSLSWDGETWIGLQPIANVEIGAESGGFVPSEAVLSVNGPLATVLDYMDPAARGGEVVVWFGATTEPGGTTLIGEPCEIFSGTLDNNSMKFTPETGVAELSVGVATGPGARSKAVISHSDEDQQAKHLGDTFFQRCTATDLWLALPLQFPNPG